MVWSPSGGLFDQLGCFLGLSWVVRGLRYFEAALDVRGNSGAFSRSPGGILEASCRFYGVINMKFLTENKETLKGPS